MHKYIFMLQLSYTRSNLRSHIAAVPFLYSGAWHNGFNHISAAIWRIMDVAGGSSVVSWDLVLTEIYNNISTIK